MHLITGQYDQRLIIMRLHISSNDYCGTNSVCIYYVSMCTPTGEILNIKHGESNRP